MKPEPCGGHQGHVGNAGMYRKAPLEALQAPPAMLSVRFLSLITPSDGSLSPTWVPPSHPRLGRVVESESLGFTSVGRALLGRLLLAGFSFASVSTFAMKSATDTPRAGTNLKIVFMLALFLPNSSKER